MINSYGCQNMVDPIRRVLVKHPKDAYQDQIKLNKQSSQLNYLGVPNFDKALADYETLVGFIIYPGMILLHWILFIHMIPVLFLTAG